MAETTQLKRRTKRRGYGEGSIFQRGDGRWTGTISLGYGADGKRQRRTVYGKTKKEVQDELGKLQSQKLDGTLAKPSRRTIAEYLDRYVEDTVRTTCRRTTYNSYRTTIKTHVNPRIGGVPLAKLTPDHIAGMLSDMERSGASARMRQYVYTILRRAFQVALKRGAVARNVCVAVERPRAPKPEMKTWTVEQCEAFFAAADGIDSEGNECEPDRLRALYPVAIATGLRQGELFGLQWADIDLEAGTLAVRRELCEDNGKHYIEEPKSKKGIRAVALPAMAIDALQEHRKRMLTEGFAGSDWVFCDTRGGALRKSNVRRNSYIPILERAGLPYIRFHDLRHTAATVMLTQGVHPKVAQERLGHSQISLTLDTYSHVLPSMQADAASRIDGAFNRRKTAAG